MSINCKSASDSSIIMHTQARHMYCISCIGCSAAQQHRLSRVPTAAHVHTTYVHGSVRLTLPFPGAWRSTFPSRSAQWTHFSAASGGILRPLQGKEVIGVKYHSLWPFCQCDLKHRTIGARSTGRTMIGWRALIDKIHKFFCSLLSDLRTRKRISEMSCRCFPTDGPMPSASTYCGTRHSVFELQT